MISLQMSHFTPLIWANKGFLGEGKHLNGKKNQKCSIHFNKAVLGNMTVALALVFQEMWLKIKISTIFYFTLYKSEYFYKRKKVLKIQSVTWTQVTEKLAALQKL